MIWLRVCLQSLFYNSCYRYRASTTANLNFLFSVKDKNYCKAPTWTYNKIRNGAKSLLAADRISARSRCNPFFIAS